MLSQIRQWNEQTTNLEDTVELMWAARGIRDTFEHKNVAVPEWLDAQIRALNRAIESQTRDQKELERKNLLAELAGLESRDDRRSRLSERLKALEAEGVGRS